MRKELARNLPAEGTHPRHLRAALGQRERGGAGGVAGDDAHAKALGSAGQEGIRDSLALRPRRQRGGDRGKTKRFLEKRGRCLFRLCMYTMERSGPRARRASAIPLPWGRDASATHLIKSECGGIIIIPTALQLKRSEKQQVALATYTAPDFSSFFSRSL